MAKEKRSLFEWLTGASGNESEYGFEDLESGGSSYDAREPHGRSPRIQVPVETEAEEAEGELAVDVYQTSSHIVIKAMIAGVRPEDLDVSITRDMVTLRGKRERHAEGTTGDFFFQELYWGAFSRTIVLPQEVEIEDAEATEKHGLLTIRLPKLDKGRQAKLKIKSN